MGDCLMITEPTTGVAKPVGVIGGSGHDIINASGTIMAQEDGLQFASGCVEDDAVNGKTVYIEMIRISQANYDTLKANGQLKPGAKYFIYDAQPVAVNASNLPYSSTQSTKQAIDELKARNNVKYKDIQLTSAITVNANGIATIQYVSATTIGGFIMNYDDNNLSNLMLYVDKWYSHIRLMARNFSSANVTIPANTGIRYFYLDS